MFLQAQFTIILALSTQHQKRMETENTKHLLS